MGELSCLVCFSWTHGRTLEGFADVWGNYIFKTRCMVWRGAVSASMPSMIFMGMCFWRLRCYAGLPVKLEANLAAIIGAGIVMTTGVFCPTHLAFVHLALLH